MRRESALLIWAILPVACGGDAAPPGDVRAQVRDSAGVRVVEYAETPRAGPAFVVAEEPTYRHGAHPDDYEFRGVNSGRLLPDGSAIIADRWAGEVVALSPDGGAHRVIAAQGEGPGEVVDPWAVFVRGQDSVYVHDSRQLRLTLFVADSVANVASLPRSGVLGVEGFAASGETMLANRMPYRSWSGMEEEWLAGHMALFDPETGTLDTVAAYDHWPKNPPGLRWHPIPPMGEVAVADGRFVYTRSDKPQVTWRLPGGAVSQVVRWRAEPARLTRDLLGPIEAYARVDMRMNNEGVAASRIEEIMEEIMSEHRAMIGQPMPFFGAPFADGDGNVWLPSYRPAYPREASPYTVLSPAGEWLGQVETPPRFRVLDVAHGLVLGVVRDEFDVENVAVHRLAAGSSADR